MIKPFRGNFPLTQRWGVNPADYAKFGLFGHNGQDYGLPLNTDVIAPHSGKVIEAAYDANGYGLYYKIENDKEGSVLGHLKENYLAIGATVMEGQLIGKSGNTGNSTGPHLHWGWYLFPRDRGDGILGFMDQGPILKAIEQKYFSLGVNVDEIVKKLQAEMDSKLALKDGECKQKLQDIKNKINSYVNSL
ncbi:MAG: M23 family metallopeptidase [Bacteroidetes bacterium]|nr:M23 family metallopeptidase [Bacteroidota bacterium]